MTAAARAFGPVRLFFWGATHGAQGGESAFSGVEKH